ncbi:lipoate--protein ligase family protein [Candidatus Aerophobetes bacterium]|nr:lipoate--protein ligase family protein [Candidatus Aerophobetes bacterium]
MTLSYLKKDFCREWILFNREKKDSAKILPQQEKLAVRVGQGLLSPFIEVWIPTKKCFVIGKYYAKKLEKAGKMEELKKSKIPFVLRSSGGEVILHDSTCLCIAVALPADFFASSFPLSDAFLLFSTGITAFLKKIKITASFGKTKSFCPGAYDLVAGKKKIMGNSLLFQRKFCLIHGTLLVNSKEEYFEKLKFFYPDIHKEATSLSLLAGINFNMEEVIEGIIKGYMEKLSITILPHSPGRNHFLCIIP